MSDFTVIREVSRALRKMLADAFQGDAETAQLIPDENTIAFTNPTETAKQTANKLSLWLYRVTENEHVKNQPMRRTSGPNGTNTEQFPPLALNLYYLLTPFASSADPEHASDHLLLGKAMQTLYDHATTILVDPRTPGVAEELHIILCRLTLEEFTRIWEALMEPYRLSVCYEVRVTRLDSQRFPSHARVIEQNTGYGNVPADPSGASELLGV